MTLLLPLSAHQIAPDQTYFRVQRTKGMYGSVKRNGLLLRPPGSLLFRFDLIGYPTAYMADSKLTACYEGLFRRDLSSCSMADLRQRSLVEFQNRKSMKLADLRALGERYPVLISQRYQSTQGFALRCFENGLDGVIYNSAQHPGHDCIAIFETGIEKITASKFEPLVKPETDQLLRVVLNALDRAQIKLTP